MRFFAPLVFLFAAVFGSSTTHAQILPPNNLHLQDTILDANIDEKAFNSIIDSVTVHYDAVVQAMGAKLVLNKRWSDSTVNAYAQQLGNNWVVTMFGGLARRPEVTPDGFALVVCHELGHHLGGFPFYGNADWAASEGQSDYFATQACARMIWRNDHAENAKAANTVHAVPKAKCNALWPDQASRDLCYRSANAGFSLATLLGALRGVVPSFDTRDSRVVSQTQVSHPEAQCRLDTYFEGALCKNDFDEKVIPGRRHSAGQTSLEAEKEAATYSCTQQGGYTDGHRPLCWFKPRI